MNFKIISVNNKHKGVKVIVVQYEVVFFVLEETNQPFPPLIWVIFKACEEKK